MTTLVATSVVRGSRQGDSHGGVYLVDLAQQEVRQVIDWNTSNIDWQGRGHDRGLRGIAFGTDRVYIAASDELFAYTPDFRLIGSWRNPYLRHCHEICAWQEHLFLTSTGYDAVLVFDTRRGRFEWAVHVEQDDLHYRARRFDPHASDGPLMLNRHHLNNVCCDAGGMYLSGLHTGGLLHYNGRKLSLSATLPEGTHNARPFRDGVLFNDTAADVVRYASRDPAEDRVFEVPHPPADSLTGLGLDEASIARPRFGRGLCMVSETLVAAGSSPSTIAVHDLASGRTGLTVQVSTDVRNAIHGLAVWPF